jgi:hypothetical protein
MCSGACRAGSYAGAGAGTTAECTACVAGSRTDTGEVAGASSCTPCEAGKYSAESNVTVCSDCAAGQYGHTGTSNNSLCAGACPAGSYAGPGAGTNSSCIKCTAHATSFPESGHVSACLCNPQFEGVLNSFASVCRACETGMFKATVGAEACGSDPFAAVGRAALMLATEGVVAAQSAVTAVSDAFGAAEASDQIIAARTELLRAVVDATGDMRNLSREVLSASLALATTLTSTVPQMSSNATDIGLEFVASLAQGPREMVGNDTTNAAMATSNLFGATQQAFGNTTADADSARQRGSTLSRILQRVTVAVARGNVSDTIETPKFQLTAHSMPSVSETTNLSAAGYSVSLPVRTLSKQQRRRLAAVGGTIQTVRYKGGTSPHFWAGNELTVVGSPTLAKTTDVLTVTFLNGAGAVETVRNLTENATIWFPISKTSDSNPTDRIRCAFWDTNLSKWVYDGEGVNATNSSVACRTSHFTGAPRPFPASCHMCSL